MRLVASLVEEVNSASASPAVDEETKDEKVLQAMLEAYANACSPEHSSMALAKAYEQGLELLWAGLAANPKPDQQIAICLNSDVLRANEGHHQQDLLSQLPESIAC